MFEEFVAVRISFVINGEQIVCTAVSIPLSNRAVNVSDVISREKINYNIIDITKSFIRRIDCAIGVKALNSVISGIGCEACNSSIVKSLI